MKPSFKAGPASPSRFFTVMGGIQVFLGVIVPVRVYLSYQILWKFMNWIDASRIHQITYIASLVETFLLGALSVASGWMLLKRRSWAPMIACIAGGAILAEVIYRAYSLHPYTARIILNTITEPRYRSVAFSPALDILMDLARLGCWLATLGGIYRQRGRLEFPPSRPELTTANFWIWITVSAVVEGLFKGWMMVVWWANEVQ